MARAPKDVAGQVFGTLTAVRVLDDRSTWLFKCGCGCGGDVTRPLTNVRRSIRKGFKPSCQKTAFDYRGQKFGSLTAIRRDGDDEHGTAAWIFSCDCGCGREVRRAIHKVAYADRHGSVSTCGSNEDTRCKAGEVYGELMVLGDADRPSGKKPGMRYVSVRCSCGVEKVVRANLIRFGQTTSCGHVKRQTMSRAKRQERRLLALASKGRQ